MSQEKTAEIINLDSSRAVAAGDHAGAFLQAARMNAGLDVLHVADATKIKPEHVEAIEAGDASRLPATPYAVGFVKVYAAYLGLDAEGVAAEFRKEITRARPEPEAPRSTAPLAKPSDGVKIISLIGVVLILAFAVWIAFQIAGNAERVEAENAANDPAPRIVVSEQRAEAPRPRIVVRPETAPGDYAVAAIPDAPTAADLEAAAAKDAAQVVSNVAHTPAEDVAPVIAQPAPEPAPRREPQAVASANEDAQSPAPVSETSALPIEELPAEEIVAPSPVELEIIEARLKRSIGPEYPARCTRTAEALESVSLIFDVTADGLPANARVTSATNECFNDAAIAAISKWRFDPRTVGGAATSQQGLQATLNFRK